MDGRYVFELSEHVEFVDAFGHKQLAGSAKFLANKVGSELGIKTRAIELSTLQRCAAHMTSRTDITEVSTLVVLLLRLHLKVKLVRL